MMPSTMTSKAKTLAFPQVIDCIFDCTEIGLGMGDLHCPGSMNGHESRQRLSKYFVEIPRLEELNRAQSADTPRMLGLMEAAEISLDRQ